ncbi:MAG: hypothetical protein HYU64_04455 [Armatimonadetes bacterium]|nr:hypothetical protein [Armatimonadota bacterium]
MKKIHFLFLSIVLVFLFISSSSLLFAAVEKHLEAPTENQRQSFVRAHYQVDFLVKPVQLSPKTEAEIKIRVLDTRSRKPQPVSGVKVQVSLSSQGATFVPEDIKVEEKETGTFVCRRAFPQTGEYWLVYYLETPDGLQVKAPFQVIVAPDIADREVPTVDEEGHSKKTSKKDKVSKSDASPKEEPKKKKKSKKEAFVPRVEPPEYETSASLLPAFSPANLNHVQTVGNFQIALGTVPAQPAKGTATEFQVKVLDLSKKGVNGDSPAISGANITAKVTLPALPDSAGKGYQARPEGSSGIYRFAHTFPMEGEYRVLVTVRTSEDEIYRAVFPLEVETSKPQ